MQLAHRPAVRQISANQEWIFGCDRDIELPSRSGGWKCDLRPSESGLRRGASRKPNWNEIDVL